MSTQTVQDDLGARPAAAISRGHLLRAELRRLSHRRLVMVLSALAVVAVIGCMAIAFFAHSQDVVGARADAIANAKSDRAVCLQENLAEPGPANPSTASPDDPGNANPGGPDGPVDPGTAEEMCGPEITDLNQGGYFRDPRFLPDPGLAMTSVVVGVGGALLAALIGATGVGADWSSRAMITLLTWEPRRLRLLGTRYVAIAMVCSLLGLVLQGLGLALGALTVTLRGTWAGTTVPSSGMDGEPGSTLMLGADTFWRDLLSLQLRGVVLMALAGVLAAAITTLARHTGGLLGVLFGWFAVVETAVRAFGWERGWDRWLLSSNIGAFLTPGGTKMQTGIRRVVPGGQDAGGDEFRTVLVSNLDALLYLGCITAAFVLLAGLLLRRRDL